MSFFIPAAHAQPNTAPPEGSGFTILIFVAMFAVMYFLIIRPQQKRQKEHKNLMSGIDKGDEVMTIGGMLGKVIRIEGDYVVLDVGSNVHLKFQKVSIQAVLPKGTIKSI